MISRNLQNKWSQRSLKTKSQSGIPFKLGNSVGVKQEPSCEKTLLESFRPYEQRNLYGDTVEGRSPPKARILLLALDSPQDRGHHQNRGPTEDSHNQDMGSPTS